MPDLKKIQSIHDNLAKEGYDMPDVNTMAIDLQDETKARKLYETLTTEKFELPDFETFQNDLGLKKKEDTSVPSATPSQVSSANAPSSGLSSTSQNNVPHYGEDWLPVLDIPSDVVNTGLYQNYQARTGTIDKPKTQADVAKFFFNPATNLNLQNFTNEERKNQFNQLLVDEKILTPEQVAEQKRIELEKQKDAAKDTGVKIEDFLYSQNATTDKTVNFEGRDYEHTPFFKLNNQEYAILNDGTKIKLYGDKWVPVTNEEADLIDNRKSVAQNNFKSKPQNITKNLFIGDDEQQYIVDANNYLLNLKETNPQEYDNIASKVLLYKGGDFFEPERKDVKQDNLSIQSIKQKIINGSQDFKLKDKIEDLDVIAKRVGGSEQIGKYISAKNSLSSSETTPEEKAKIQEFITTNFPVGQIEDIEKALSISDEITDARNKIEYANQNITKELTQKQNFQVAYNTAAKAEKDRYSKADVPKTIWNTSLQASNGIFQLPKRLDIDNEYGLLDLWSDSFNEWTRDLSAVTADRTLYNSKTGEWDGSAILPGIAGGLTSMALLARGGGGLGKSLGSYNTGIVASGFALQHNDYYRQAINSNLMTPQQANIFAIGAASLTSMLELVSPGEKIWGEGGLTHIGVDEAMKRFAKGEPLNTILNFKGVVKEVGSEVAQETSQDVGDKLSNGIANTIIGKNALDTQYNLGQFVQTAAFTAGATLLAGGFKGLVSKGQAREEIVNKLAANNAIDIALQTLEDNVKTGVITQEKANELTEELTTRNAQLNELPKEYSDSKMEAIVELKNQLLPYQKQEYEVRDGVVVNRELTQGEKDAVAEIQDKIKEYTNHPNEYFDNLKRTEQEKAELVNEGNATPITSELENIKSPENAKEVADEIKPIIEKAEELKSEDVASTENNILPTDITPQEILLDKYDEGKGYEIGDLVADSEKIAIENKDENLISAIEDLKKASGTKGIREAQDRVENTIRDNVKRITTDRDIKKLESERDSKIKNTDIPEIGELKSITDAEWEVIAEKTPSDKLEELGNKHDEINSNFEELKKLINCLHGKR